MMKFLLVVLLSVTQAYAGVFPFAFWKTGTVFLASACTGGTLTTDGNYKVCKYTSSGTLTFTAGAGNVDYIVVAGGGGGGEYYGGGGGGGGVVTATGYAVTATAYTIVVGAGGAAGDAGTTNG